MKGDRLADIRTAGVVVLYRPDSSVLDAVASYRHQVHELIVVDNSEEQDHELHSRLRDRFGATIVGEGRNLGIAAALNRAAREALVEGFDLLLTMDQDSRAEPGMVEQMLACLGSDWRDRVGIVAPFHLTGARPAPGGTTPCSDVMTPMTSGCLVNLAAFREAGPFRDDFFIDFVDNEYCLRLRKKGFQVIRANRALLHHRVGDLRRYGPFVATHHSPLRRYYKTRNRCAVFAEYLRDFPAHCLFDLVRLGKEVASILIFEREKTAKLRMMWRGFLDFRRGRFGPYGG